VRPLECRAGKLRTLSRRLEVRSGLIWDAEVSKAEESELQSKDSEGPRGQGIISPKSASSQGTSNLLGKRVRAVEVEETKEFEVPESPLLADDVAPSMLLEGYHPYRSIIKRYWTEEEVRARLICRMKN